MSHSWHDNASTKWARVKDFATEFQRKRRRFPTFWLDTVCIDQKYIADGLKVLPVNVMACHKVLVLFGNTYPDRLWCVWELYTLLCFTDGGGIVKRLDFVALDTPDID